MIYVDLGKVDVSGEWLAEATRLTHALMDASAEDRPTIIGQHEGVWRDLKRVLALVSHGKCWYCESLQNRSDNAVDHYRPKGRLAEDTAHGGYWWLSFNVENYRFSCTFCNSRRRDVERSTAGGKQDHFPVIDEQARARAPSDSLAAEQPLLLDPCRVGDVVLLWFDDGGQATVHPAYEGDVAAVARIAASRDIYHLDHGDIVRDRRRVYRDVTRLVKRADNAFAAMTGSDPHARELFEDLLRQLKQRTNDESEYAAVARCAVRGLKVSSGAVQALIESL